MLFLFSICDVIQFCCMLCVSGPDLSWITSLSLALSLPVGAELNIILSQPSPVTPTLSTIYSVLMSHNLANKIEFAVFWM